jgi:hypothetical protein
MPEMAYIGMSVKGAVSSYLNKCFRRELYTPKVCNDHILEEKQTEYIKGFTGPRIYFQGERFITSIAAVRGKTSYIEITLDNNKKVLQKPAKFFRFLAEHAGLEYTDHECEKFHTEFQSEYNEDVFFISEPGDLDRLSYAYLDGWGGDMSNSCLRLENYSEPNPNLDFIPEKRRFHGNMADYILPANLPNWRVCLISDADTKKLLARALLRRVFLWYDYEVELGWFLDRVYTSGNVTKARQMLERVRLTLGNNLIGYRNLGYHNAKSAKVFWYINLDEKLHNPYLKHFPNFANNHPPYQDSFRNFDVITNRLYLYKDPQYPRRTIELHFNYMTTCVRCNKTLLLNNMDSTETGKRYCAKCAKDLGMKKCDTCPKWLENSNGIKLLLEDETGTNKEIRVCSYDCLTKMDYYKCCVCNNIKRHKTPPSKVGENWLCSNECATKFFENNTLCRICQSVGRKQGMKLIHNHYYCSISCIHKVWSTCNCCNEYFPRNTGIESDNLTACSIACAESHGYTLCEQCNEYANNGIVLPTGHHYCDRECFRAAGWFECASCGEYERYKDGVKILAENVILCNGKCKSDFLKIHFKCYACGKYHTLDKKIDITPNLSVCSAPCARNYGYVKCNICPVWHNQRGTLMERPGLGWVCNSGDCFDNIHTNFKKCENCDKYVRIGTNFAIQIDENTHFCSINCASAKGFYKCKYSGCSKLHRNKRIDNEQINIKFCLNSDTYHFCTEECARFAGYEKDAHTDEWFNKSWGCSTIPGDGLEVLYFKTRNSAIRAGYEICDECSKAYDYELNRCPNCRTAIQPSTVINRTERDRHPESRYSETFVREMEKMEEIEQIAMDSEMVADDEDELLF